MLTREPTLKEAMDFLELNAYEGSNAITTLRMGDIEEILKPIRKLVNEHFNPQPYKYEDLKVGMWVWDNQLKWFFEIEICKVEIEGYENLKMFKVKDFDDSLRLIIFEEGRFFPVTKAMEYQKEK